MPSNYKTISLDKNNLPLNGIDKFGFGTIANAIIRRQDQKRDTIIVIIGGRGEGKSTAEISIIDHYLEIQKARGLIKVKNWRRYFQNNFAMSTSDANSKFKTMIEGDPESFLCLDEGEALAYSGDAAKRIDKQLIKTIAKVRKKMIPCVICLPYYEMLNKRLLKMTNFMIVVPYRFLNYWSYAFVYARNPNTVRPGDGYDFTDSEKMLKSNARGDYQMIKRIVKFQGKPVREVYPKQIFRKLATIPSFKAMFRFRKLPENIESMYDSIVKNKLIAAEDEEEYVSARQYVQQTYQLKTLIFNLVNKHDMKQAQIHRALMDSWGRQTMSLAQVKSMLDSVRAMDSPPKIELPKEDEVIPEIKVAKEEIVDLDKDSDSEDDKDEL